MLCYTMIPAHKQASASVDAPSWQTQCKQEHIEAEEEQTHCKQEPLESEEELERDSRWNDEDYGLCHCT